VSKNQEQSANDKSSKHNNLQENKMSKLTQEQIDRQDFVDNAIFRLINDLVPYEYQPSLVEQVEDHKIHAVTRDQDWIGDIRDLIQDCIRVQLNIGGHIFDPHEHARERERFEKEFYPFIADESASPSEPKKTPAISIAVQIFPDAKAWLIENLPDPAVDSVAAVYPLIEFNPNGPTTYRDEEENTEKECSLDDHVRALRLLAEQVGNTLFVGSLTSPLQLTDTSNWDVEVVDAFYQLVYHGEVIYG
jgi:hypothetical protein